jgi:hypothetical protein
LASSIPLLLEFAAPFVKLLRLLPSPVTFALQVAETRFEAQERELRRSRRTFMDAVKPTGEFAKWEVGGA